MFVVFTNVLIAANSHLKLPRPAPIWPRSSVGRATVICSGAHGFESHRGQRFFSFSVWPHFLSKAVTQKVLFGIFLQQFNLPHLIHYKANNIVGFVVQLTFFEDQLMQFILQAAHGIKTNPNFSFISIGSQGNTLFVWFNRQSHSANLIVC